jgi:hypothetical protein
VRCRNQSADPSVLPDLVVAYISLGRDFEADAMILVVVDPVVGDRDVLWRVGHVCPYAVSVVVVPVDHERVAVGELHASCGPRVLVFFYIVGEDIV